MLGLNIFWPCDMSQNHPSTVRYKQHIKPKLHSLSSRPKASPTLYLSPRPVSSPPFASSPPEPCHQHRILPPTPPAANAFSDAVHPLRRPLATTATADNSFPSQLSSVGYSFWQILREKTQIDPQKMGKPKADEMILSYNDVVLRRSDLDILSGPYYLNDRIIEFYFAYLESRYPSEDILVVSPSVAFWCINCPDAGSLEDFLKPLDLPKRRLVIFPVNNNEDVTKAEGGTHWSLLAFESESEALVHHDSYGGMNGRFARRLYEAVGGFMDISSDGNYVECSGSPQQVNGYDCGLYVLATTRTICSWYCGGESRERKGLWFSELEREVTPSAVAEMRGQILGLVRSFMAEARKS